MPLGASRLNFISKKLAAAVATKSFRSDSYSANLELAVPFDSDTITYDVHADIVGSGTNITPTVGLNSSITDTQVKWTSSPDYDRAYEGVATSGQQQLTYALGTSIPSSASGTFVIEGWFYANSATTNANWCISSADSGGRFLFSFNTGTTFTFGNENNIGIGSGWHHIAIVCDSGTKRFYYDGIYKGAWVSSNTGFSTLHLGQFNSGDTNDFRGHIQDFRVYVGTNKGYTGTNSGSANFTLPSSIVETFGSVPAGYGGIESNITDGATNYRVHQFLNTGSSTFTASADLSDVEVLVVGGGGGGGVIGWAAGGGAGGLIEGTFSSITTGSYTVTVGAGGPKGTDGTNGENGTNGGNSTFNGLTAVGGGGGGGSRNSSVPGSDGGSGGGGNADRDGNNNNVGGSGTQTTPSVTGFTGTGYGNDGGDGNLLSADGGAGGGGGAGAVGGDATQSSSASAGGDGGIGRQSSITGTTKYYADGGGGGSSVVGDGGVGGSGTGGNGFRAPTSKPNGDANSGSGGGGDVGNGGSGIVVIRYER